MQYILTEDEFRALREKLKIQSILEKKKLQALCTKICNEMPVRWGRSNKRNDPDDFKPWGCIHTTEGEWYCDDCPVRAICPSEQRVSK